MQDTARYILGIFIIIMLNLCMLGLVQLCEGYNLPARLDTRAEIITRYNGPAERY